MLNKVIFLLLGWSLMQVLAGEYDWMPADTSAIHEKCKEAHPLSTQTMDELDDEIINDSPALRDLLLCTAKGLNVYSTEKGFDADRLAYSVYRSTNSPCNRELVRECVTRHRAVQPEGAMVVSVAQCIHGVEMKTFCDGKV